MIEALIGMPYRLGGDGSDGTIDCIHLVYRVTEAVGVEMPPFKESWYEMDWRVILADLDAWGRRVERPAYDGDIVLCPQETAAFAVTWQKGILYINNSLGAVGWCPIEGWPICRCYRLRGS